MYKQNYIEISWCHTNDTCIKAPFYRLSSLRKGWFILDPSRGSGGFLTGALRYIPNKIVNRDRTKITKQRQLDTVRNRLFMVKSSKRLVKVAKTAIILNGDGYTGITHQRETQFPQFFIDNVCNQWILEFRFYGFQELFDSPPSRAFNQWKFYFKWYLK